VLDVLSVRLRSSFSLGLAKSPISVALNAGGQASYGTPVAEGQPMVKDPRGCLGPVVDDFASLVR